MVKILSVFGILLALFPNVAYCNNSISDKKLIISAKKAFKQKKVNNHQTGDRKPSNDSNHAESIGLIESFRNLASRPSGVE